MKFGWILLGGAGLFFGGRYLMQMNRLENELETVITAKIHKLSLSGITLRVDVQLKNPTKGKIKMNYPFVKILHDGKTIGSSQSVKQEVEIPSFGEARIEAVMIDLPYSQLLINAWNMVQLIQDGKPVTVQVKVISSVKMIWGDQPYEEMKEVTLKQ